jgi:hypothetical protein
VKKQIVVLFALTMVLGLSSIAGANPMDSVSWQVYDSFPGPDLNTMLWNVNNQSNATFSAGGGLNVSLGASGNWYMRAISGSGNSGNWFALRVPFRDFVGSGTGDGAGMDVQFSGLSSGVNSDVFVGRYYISGQHVIVSAMGSGDPYVLSPMYSVPYQGDQGQLGLLYDGTTVSAYYNPTLSAVGWILMESYIPGWSGSIRIGVEASADAGGHTSFTLDSVQTVPIPGAVWLLSTGLAGLATFRRRSRKS